MVWQGPCLVFVAKPGKKFAMETPWVRLSCLLWCLASYFSFFVFLFFIFLIFFPASRYVYLLHVSSSVQQPSATLSKYVFCSTYSFCLCHLYPTPSRNYFVVFIHPRFVWFFVALISRVAFFLLCSRTLYAGTWLAYLDSWAFGFSLSYGLTTEFVSL